MKTRNLIFNLLKPEWFYLSLGLLLTIITIVASIGLLSVAGYLIAGAALAGVLGTASTFNYFLPAAGVRFFALVRIASRYGERVFSHEATFRVLKNIRVWFYQVLEPLAPAHLLEQTSGELLNRVISDIDTLNKLYLQIICPFIAAGIIIILSCLFIGFFSIHISLWLLFILLLSAIVLPCITYFLGKNPGMQVIHTLASMRAKFVELSKHLLELTLLQKNTEYETELLKQHDQLMQSQLKQASINGLAAAVMTLLTSVSTIIVLILGVALLEHHLLARANLALLILALFGLFEALTVLPRASQFIGQMLLAAKNVFNIANIKPVVTFANDKALNITNYDLKIDAIDFRYNEESPWVFQAFSRDIKFQTHMGVVAATGKGKSTLAYLLARIYDPNKGNIYLGEKPLQKLSEEQLRNSIFYSHQNAYLFNNTIRENLLLAKPDASDAELFEILKQVNLEELLSELPEGLDTLMGELGKQFSGGQQKRFILARAFLKSAPITILDEPLEGVDEETAKIIWGNLQSFFTGKTLLVITHQRSQIPESFEKLAL